MSLNKSMWDAGQIVDEHSAVIDRAADEHDAIIDGTHIGYGREWAIPRRWTIALDSGSLVFRDDDTLELE